MFSNQAASPPDIYKKNFFPKKYYQTKESADFTPFPLATFEMSVSNFWTTLHRGCVSDRLAKETDRMVLRANSEALPWEPVPEGLDLPVFKWIESHININVIWWWYQMLGFQLYIYICMIGYDMIWYDMIWYAMLCYAMLCYAHVMYKCINKVWFKEAVEHNLHLAFSQASPEISLALMWAMPALTLPALRRISACCPGALRPWDPGILTKPRSWALDSLKVNVFQQQKCNFSKYIVHTLSHSTLPHFHFNTAVFFRRYREAELAHGRVCMLATLGFSVQTSGAKFEPFITRNSDVWKISMFSLPGLLLFLYFDFWFNL